MLCFQLCSAHYIALQTKNSTRRVSAINPVTTESTGDKPTQPQGGCIMPLCELTTCVASKKELKHKDKGGQRQVHDVYIVCNPVCAKTHLGMKQR